MREKRIALILLMILGFTVVSISETWVAKAEGTIYIRPDGAVEITDRIQRDGNTYTFNDNIFNEIVVERENITVDGNGFTLYGPRSGIGIDLAKINNVTIHNVNIQDFNYGILLQNSFHNNISGNNIRNNFNGINLTYSYDNIISENNITDNNVGISFFGGSHNMISGNIILNNSKGFQMYGSYNTISGNTISNNSGEGLILSDSSMYNAISENTIANNSEGIYLTRSIFNGIFENNITDNNNGMCFRLQSSNNTLYSNNLVNNDLQILIDANSVNAWDNGATGNYWNDYNGIDNDDDGVGDTPYIIDENNQDNYPLMNPNIIPLFTLMVFLSLFLTGTLVSIILPIFLVEKLVSIIIKKRL